VTAHIEFRGELAQLREDIDVSPESQWKEGALNALDIIEDLVAEWLDDCPD